MWFVAVLLLLTGCVQLRCNCGEGAEGPHLMSETDCVTELTKPELVPPPPPAPKFN